MENIVELKKLYNKILSKKSAYSQIVQDHDGLEQISVAVNVEWIKDCFDEILNEDKAEITLEAGP